MEVETRYRALEMALKASGPTRLGTDEDTLLVKRARAFAQYLEDGCDDAMDQLPTRGHAS
jgi:hypothetical protein